MTAVEPSPPGRDRLPGPLRLLDAARVGPALGGLLIAAAVLLAYLAWAGLTGPWEPEGSTGQLWFELLQAVLIGYAPAAAAISLRGGLRDLDDLRDALQLSAVGFERERRALVQFPRGRLLLAVLTGAAVGAAIPFNPSGWMGGVRPGLGDPFFVWALLRNVLMLGLYGATVYYGVELARRFSRIGGQLARVDLLDLTPLRPFARQGLRSVLLWVVLSALLSLLFLAPWSSDPAIGFLALVFALATALLLLPAWGVHQRILATRQAELARIRELLRVGRLGLLEPAAGGGIPPGHIADLVAYEDRIASVPTWPFDLSTLVRFALYVALGLGSWLGAAVVERFVDAVVG